MSEAERASILVVDDDAVILRHVTEKLMTRGYNVATAADGASAVERALQKSFDLIISDIVMPGISGIQVLRRMRAFDGDLPIVLLTGDPKMETALEALELGAFRYLMKPIDDDALTETVERALLFGRLARLKRHALSLYLGPTETGGARLDAAMDSLWLAYQPIVDVSARRVFGYEVLVRSNERGLELPTELFHAAEQFGRVDELSRRIRRMVGVAASGAAKETTLFLNIHPSDLRDPELYVPDSLFARNAERVVLEVTERASLERMEGVRARIIRLRALGFRIAIDDLGAGYAGLNSFALLEPDLVKIDISLIHNISNDSIKQKLVSSIAGLCKDLGILVVCEGVESAAERDALMALGCNLAQGFLFARPGEAFPPLSAGAFGDD